MTIGKRTETTRAWVVLSVLFLSGCGLDAHALVNTRVSLDGLGAKVVEAFNEDDAAALNRLRLTEAEHNHSVWPEFPAAQGPNPFPVDLAWQNIELRNRRAIARLRDEMAHFTPVQFVSVECRGETRAFETFRVHTDCYTWFKRGGTLYEIQFFKDALERDGKHKVFRFYDEEPRVVAGDE